MIESSPEQNPYAAPLSGVEIVRKPAATVPLEVSVPCPKCQSTTISPVPYNAATGRAGPRAHDHVACLQCGAEFDGETGDFISTRIRLKVVIPLFVLGAAAVGNILLLFKA